MQHFFDDGILDVDEKQGDVYQRILKENIPMFKERAGASLYVWDGLQWYDDPRNLTMHTVIATPYCLMPLSGSPFSIATWAMNAVEGICESYGLDLVDKEYD